LAIAIPLKCCKLESGPAVEIAAGGFQAGRLLGASERPSYRDAKLMPRGSLYKIDHYLDTFGGSSCFWLVCCGSN
jgi:hypothetical protein